jgi:pimeloyl-ACP methyl ester carboxylesterase
MPQLLTPDTLPNRPYLLALPGLGGDYRMYAGPWLRLPDLVRINWPTNYLPHSIIDLARWTAARLPGPPRLIIGSSMGGMVGLELARLLKVSDVCLVGSATSHREINPSLRRLAPLARVAPFTAAAAFASGIPLLPPQMFAQQNPEFIRTMIKRIVTWSFSGRANIFRIHGRHDPIIPYQRADRVVNGTHLISVRNAAACVEAIQDHYSFS